MTDKEIFRGYTTIQFPADEQPEQCDEDEVEFNEELDKKDPDEVYALMMKSK